MLVTRYFIVKAQVEVPDNVEQEWASLDDFFEVATNDTTVEILFPYESDLEAANLSNIELIGTVATLPDQQEPEVMTDERIDARK